MTYRQLRMARAALGWSVRELAQISSVSPNTISRIENGSDAMQSTLDILATVFRKAGIRFDGSGGVSFERVEWRKTIEGDAPPPNVDVLINYHIGPQKVQKASFDHGSRRWTISDSQMVLEEVEVPMWTVGPWPLDRRWLNIQ